MKNSIMRHSVGLVLIIIVSLLIGLAGQPPSARAGTVRNLEIIESTCAMVRIQFNYDGSDTRSILGTAYPPDQFRAQVWNRTCGSGGCDFKIGEGWLTVPDRPSPVTMTITWAPVIPNGNGIEIIVEQMTGSTPSQPTNPSWAGERLSVFYQCYTGVPPCSTCNTNPLPGHASNRFLFYCTERGVDIASGGAVVLRATFAQIAGPLNTATTTAKNQMITSANGISLWALKSNELQVHNDSNPDATKLVVRSDICGSVAAKAAAQPATVGTVGTQPVYTAPVNTAGRTTYLVQPGDNLFRISLRFNRSMAAIASANGITNYSLIYAGQVLVIP